MSFIEMKTRAPRIDTAVCRHCELEIWRLDADDVWLCDEHIGLYCPDTGRGTPSLHAPLPHARQSPASTPTLRQATL